MAEDKKDGGSVTLLNRSQRSFDLGLDEKGKSKGRHAPGTAHTYTAEEAKRLEGYKELMDVSKIPGALDARKLKDENNKLLDENARLKAQLLTLEASAKEEPAAPAKEPKRKEK